MDLLSGIEENGILDPVEDAVEDVLFEEPADGIGEGGENASGAENDGATGSGNDDGVDLVDDLLGDGDGGFNSNDGGDVINKLITIGNDRKYGQGGDGDDEITIERNDGGVAFGGKGNDKLMGGAGNDKLIGKWGSNLLDGGEGDDDVRGGDGADTMMGGNGNDRGAGGDGDDDIKGGRGNDILRGDKGRDTIDGGDDDDRLFGFADEDSIMGGNGDDIVRGGLANDFLFGGAGNDILRGGQDEDHLEGGEGADQLFGGNGNDSVRGDAGNDRLEGQSGRDTLDGGEGADDLRGGSEDDQIFGGLGADYALGGTGDDLIEGGDDHDRLFGEGGDDSIAGDAGDDRVIGGSGADTLFGGLGNDVVNGGTENDHLFGGDGADTMGGASGDDSMLGKAGADRLNGGTGNDSIFGGLGNDAIDGGGNADLIDGGDGDDSITGGAGNDVINGGAGHDLFVSDEGDDILTGGEGAEWFYYENENFGHDTITDFDAAGGDLLDLSATGLTRADLTITQVSETTIRIDVPDNRSITLDGVSEFDINSAALHFGAEDGAVEVRDFINNGSFENLADSIGNVLQSLNGNGNGVHDATEVAWYSEIEGWKSNDGKIEIKGEDNATSGVKTAAGDFYVNLDDGSSRAYNENNELHQDVQGLTEGRSYTLQFDFANQAGDSDGYMDVFFGGEKVASITSNDGSFATKTFQVTGGAGDGSDRLSFQTGNTGREAGAYVDNVKLLGYADTDGDLTPVGESSGVDTVIGGAGDDTIEPEGREFIVNGSFEDFIGAGKIKDTFNSDRDGVQEDHEVFWYEKLNGWTSDDDAIEVKGQNFAGEDGIRATDGDYYVELDDGTSRDFNDNRDISQKVEGLKDGEAYTLTFDSANRTGDSDGHIDVFFGGEKIGTVSSNSGEFQSNTFEVVGGAGDGKDELTFETAKTHNESGALIDNVSLIGLATGDELTGDDGRDRLKGGDLDDTLTGQAGDDKLEGKDGFDQLFGGAGRDELKGGDGNDKLFGGNGKDRLKGEKGDDTLSGGFGDDEMEGGDGADIFYFETLGFGDDKIMDFNASEGDRLDFSRIANELSDLNIFESRGDTHIVLGDGSSVELEDVRLRDFNAEEVFLFG